MATEVKETGIVGNGDLRYNIQVRQCDDGSVQQRHIWHRTQLGEHNPPLIEAWIGAYTRDFAGYTKGMVPAAQVPA